jgi:hypothetical protein
MTLGVAVLMDTGVVLIADGRVTNALDAHELMAEGFHKIRLVQPKVAAVIGGVAFAGARAADHLSASAARDAAEVVTAAAEGVNLGWQLLQQAHPAEFANHQQFRSALLLGGVGQDGRPFIALIDQAQNQLLRVEGPCYGSWKYAIFSTGGDAQVATERRIQQLARAHPIAGRRAAQAVARAVTEAIASVAETSLTVGGTVSASYITAAGVDVLLAP